MGNHPSATPVGFQAPEEVDGRCLIVVMSVSSTRLCYVFHNGLSSAAEGFCAFSGLISHLFFESLICSNRTKKKKGMQLKTGMPEIHDDLMASRSLNE